LGSVDRAENSEESRAPSSKRPTIPTRPVRKSGGRPRVIAELRELARAHAPEAVAELARLAKDAKSETARIAAIKELLDRAYGKPTQFVAAENDEPALNDLNLEELRASMLADFERVFPEYRFVPAEQLKVIPGPEKTVCDTAEACEENLG
jgi:hypothetical protein